MNTNKILKKWLFWNSIFFISSYIMPLNLIAAMSDENSLILFALINQLVIILIEKFSKKRQTDLKDLYSLKQIDFLLENSEELPPLDEIDITDNYSISYALFIFILNGIEILLLIHIVLESMHVYSELDRTTVILIVIVGIIGVLINYILEIRKINNDEKQKN
ncbi:MAG: hypothetical protein EGR89_00010 [[Eubacterium] rectale]|nr:hypothetical protein [Agathobacter rectalis]